MRHLIATLLTLFPGLGLGHALLGRWKDFVPILFLSAAAWSIAPLGFIVLDIPHFLCFLPVIYYNLTQAHRLWSE
jgi:hypothetical protein